MPIKILVDEMRIIIDLDMNLNGYDLLQSIADEFAEILKHNIHVSKIICSSDTKEAIATNISTQNEYKFERKLFGAKYIGDETIKYARIILCGRRDLEDSLYQ